MFEDYGNCVAIEQSGYISEQQNLLSTLTSSLLYYICFTGDGTVRQRKDGRWEGRIVIGYDDNGYPKTKNVLAKTKKECVEKLQKLKEECSGLKPEKVRGLRCPSGTG